MKTINPGELVRYRKKLCRVSRLYQTGDRYANVHPCRRYDCGIITDAEVSIPVHVGDLQTESDRLSDQRRAKADQLDRIRACVERGEPWLATERVAALLKVRKETARKHIHAAGYEYNAKAGAWEKKTP